ncbi:FtsB family cell division protein [Trichloromonas sp.]|uniref:FtsB family cell division protein n=1 Tax=Trichloromonas sp. TaxID=3069249 RepID=UPI002A42978E|nr:septum formation initiator family protein [Trichloromonas sp.]
MSEKDSMTRKNWFSLWPVLLVLVILGVAVWGDKGILCALRAKQQKEDLLRQVQELEAVNQALRKEIENLKSNPRYLEGIARKDLGMVKEDELVYQFRAHGRTPPADTPTAKGGKASRH